MSDVDPGVCRDDAGGSSDVSLPLRGHAPLTIFSCLSASISDPLMPSQDDSTSELFLAQEWRDGLTRGAARRRSVPARPAS